VISGPDLITFGRSYDFQCSASCYPTCDYAWIWGNDTFQGPALSLVLEEPAGALSLFCTAINPTTGKSVTAQKTMKGNCWSYLFCNSFYCKVILIIHCLFRLYFDVLE